MPSGIRLILDLAAPRHRLPDRGTAEAGYLIAYGPSTTDMFRLAAQGPHPNATISRVCCVCARRQPVQSHLKTQGLQQYSRT